MCARACLHELLGGSWVVITGVIIRVTILITHIRGPITPLITTHEPPSRCSIPGPSLYPQVEVYGPK